MKKKIHNIGTLDVRKVTEELAVELESISNVGSYISSEESELILKDVALKNVGSVIKCERGVDFISKNGTFVIDKNFMDSMVNPFLVQINGELCFANDLEIDSVSEKLRSANINGSLIVPSHISGLVQTRAAINGTTLVYDKEKSYTSKRIRLSEEYLLTYFGDKNVAVRSLIATDDIDIEAFKENFESLQVLGKCIITDENLKKLKPYLKLNQDKIKIYKAPIYYAEGDQELSEALLFRANNKNLIVEGILSCHDDHIIGTLSDINLDAKKIICNKEKCDDVKQYVLNFDQVVESFEEQPFCNYSNFTITKDYLLSIKEVLNFENYGSLYIDEDVNEINLEMTSIGIKNYGSIHMPSNLKSAIASKIVENRGSIIYVNDETKEKEADESIMYTNMGYLVL